MRRFTSTMVVALAAVAPSQDVFPYPTHVSDLANGLRVVAVPTGQPDIVCTYIIVSVGSRNEVEEGKSGFAHFFEHMMFRGTKNHTSEEQSAFFKRIGAGRNAYTTDDYTAYHTTFSKEDLDDVLKWEADRFMNLQYTQRMFRTEAMAVRGEYNKNYANPINKLLEDVRNTAFREHTYKHTTMGFLRDISAMPRQFRYSQQFFDRYYRPEYTTILVVGDIDPAATSAMVEKHWGNWERGDHVSTIPDEPAQGRSLTHHVKWATATQPWTMIAFKGPAFDPAVVDMPAIDVLMALAFGTNSDLYKELYVRDQKVDVMFSYAPDHKDPFLVGVLARLRDPKEFGHVNRRILETCREFKSQLVGEQALERVKANMRYSFVAGLTSAEDIASALAGYIANTRTPDSLNQVYETYSRVKAQDVRAMARKYFVTESRMIATLAHGEAPEDLGDEVVAVAEGNHVLLPTASPLIDFRLMFRVGAVDDPEGKEGLANLTASLMTGGGTEDLSYIQIVESLFPMAASVSAQVDKEMTVFRGTVHKDNLAAFYGILRGMLLTPGFSPEDFARVKASTMSAVDVGLRRSDDEETGKEVLCEELFTGHPYGHLTLGHLSSLERISLDDVRAFHRSMFSADRFVLGLAGDYPSELPARILRDLKTLGAGAGTPPKQVGPAAELLRSRMTIVEKPGILATGMHMGFPIEVKRGHPDWTALWLVRSWLGEHRSANSHLYQRLRHIRGLNYGDYAYIEHFPHGGAQFQPPPNVARNRQVFQIWLRPVMHDNAPFALEGAWYELDKLVKNGLSEKQFEATRAFLRKYVNLLVKTQDRRLGYALDSAFYGTPSFSDYVKTGLEELTVGKVNAAIRQHLRSDRLQFVIVTDDAEAFTRAIFSEELTEITYQSPPGEEILAEDRVIGAVRLPVQPSDVKVVPIDEVFK